ncbi:MAG: RHS repeat-associated core domain-containing protein [Chitinophagaceae bacterium]|nr:RHS repeat-associated core domain-containing protein [Chitinophagaceae bacterium]
MVLPGRKFAATDAYRYGFNGKENDKETSSTTTYDYGFRIYSPALGRFLSVDPLTKNYAALTPYQFASNNPIEGVDLDGLEYVSSKEVRIEVIRGRVKLKIENMTNVVRKSLTEYNNDPKNWAPNSIGVDFGVGSINLQSAMPQAPSSDPDPADANPNNKPGETEVGKPIAKSTGLPDHRYKGRTVTTASPSGAKGLAILAVGIELMIYGANIYVQNRLDTDKGLIDQHLNKFRAAAADVNYALSKGQIPIEFQTEERLSDIINVVLSGNSYLNSIGDEVGAKILEIGKTIYITLSVKRNEYTGRMIETNRLDGQSNKMMERNPSYDPDYVKENPPLGEQPKPNP